MSITLEKEERWAGKVWLSVRTTCTTFWLFIVVLPPVSPVIKLRFLTSVAFSLLPLGRGGWRGGWIFHTGSEGPSKLSVWRTVSTADYVASESSQSALVSWTHVSNPNDLHLHLLGYSPTASHLLSLPEHLSSVLAGVFIAGKRHHDHRNSLIKKARNWGDSQFQSFCPLASLWGA